MKQKFKNFWKDVIAFCVLFSYQLSLLSQCPTANVVSKDYFSHQCGSSHFQSLIGVQIPVYKKVGNLHLTSPLTDYIIPSGTLDVEVSKLKVYPNPVQHSRFTLQLNDNNAEQFILKLYSLDGKLVFTNYLNHAGGSAAYNINIPAALAKGIYVLRITGADNSAVFTQNILIE